MKQNGVRGGGEGGGGSAESCHGVCLCVLQCLFKPSHKHTPTRFVNESGRDSHSQTQERREGGRVGGEWAGNRGCIE